MLGGVDAGVLDRLAKVMGYMRVTAAGKPGKRLKKRDKLQMLEDGGGLAVRPLNGASHGPLSVLLACARCADGPMQPIITQCLDIGVSSFVPDSTWTTACGGPAGTRQAAEETADRTKAGPQSPPIVQQRPAAGDDSDDDEIFGGAGKDFEDPVAAAAKALEQNGAAVPNGSHTGAALFGSEARLADLPPGSTTRAHLNGSLMAQTYVSPG